MSSLPPPSTTLPNARPPAHDADQVSVLVLTGQPGVGKTAVAKEIGELFWHLREPHALIDLDELCRGLLPTPTKNFNRSLAVANLSAVWANFYAAGVRRLILARILESVDDLVVFAQAIPHARLMCCVLSAPERMIEERLTQREPGSARPFLLGITRQIATQLTTLDLPGIRVENGDRPVNAVAREILTRIAWPCPPL